MQGYYNARNEMDVDHHVHLHVNPDGSTYTTEDDFATDRTTGITYHNLGHNAAAWFYFFIFNLSCPPSINH
jgi:hypothetical protein